MSIKLKLLVDKRRNKVVFAECQSDFVEVLFSFLTLPLGVVVKLLDKKSGLGCMDKLYESVENLDAQYLQTKACKDMLLHPRSDISQHCEDVQVKLKFLELKKKFKCTNHYSMQTGVKYAICYCGSPINNVITADRESDCALVNGRGRSFLVLDNLFILQASSNVTFMLLKKHGIEDASMLEETTVELKNDDFLSLLKRSLHSQTPLTDVLLGQRAGDIDAAKAAIYKDMRNIKLEKSSVAMETTQGATSESKRINLNLFESKSTNKLLYMECDNDFADLLFSFLTLSLGLVLFFIGKNSFSLGCIHNIYESVNTLDDKEEILSAKNKGMLLKPKLPCHFVCDNTVLKLDEARNQQDEINPKLPAPKNSELARKKGGGYATTCVKFMIDAQMIVKPFSSLYSIGLMKDAGVSVGELRQKSVKIGEEEALKLLQSCLTSSTLPDGSIFTELLF